MINVRAEAVINSKNAAAGNYILSLLHLERSWIQYPAPVAVWREEPLSFVSSSKQPMDTSNTTGTEKHPLLPSGEWTGFYIYPGEAEKHQMLIDMEFKQNKIHATGTDDIGEFSFGGTYDLKELTCIFTKHYKTHTVDYRGNIDENGIWGKWSIPFNPSWGVSQELYRKISSSESMRTSGGFHIWPKKNETSEHTAAEEKKEKEEVLELVKIIRKRET